MSDMTTRRKRKRTSGQNVPNSTTTNTWAFEGESAPTRSSVMVEARNMTSLSDELTLPVVKKTTTSVSLSQESVATIDDNDVVVKDDNDTKMDDVLEANGGMDDIVNVIASKTKQTYEFEDLLSKMNNDCRLQVQFNILLGLQHLYEGRYTDARDVLLNAITIYGESRANESETVLMNAFTFATGMANTTDKESSLQMLRNILMDVDVAANTPPETKTNVATWFMLGTCLVHHNNTNALNIFKQITNTFPELQYVWRNIAAANILDHKYDEAGHIYEKQFSKNLPSVVINYSIVLIHCKQYHEAIQRLNDYLSMNPYDVRAWNTLARAYYASKNMNEYNKVMLLASTLHDELDDKPLNGTSIAFSMNYCMYLLEKCNASVNTKELCQTYSRKAVKILHTIVNDKEPSINVYYLYLRAICTQLKYDDTNALQIANHGIHVCATALNIDDCNVLVLTQLAHVCALVKSHQIGLRLLRTMVESCKFRTAIKDKEQEFALWIAVGVCYHANSLLGEAVRAYEKANELRRDDYRVHYNLGCIYYTQKDYAQAKSPLKSCIQLNSKHYKAYFLLCKIAFEQAKYSKALRYCSYVCEIRPDDIEGQNMMREIKTKRVQI